VIRHILGEGYARDHESPGSDGARRDETERAPIAAPISTVTATVSQSTADFRIPSGVTAPVCVSLLSTMAGRR
jgi:hypothetical protein